uniref:Transcription initiation factor TFIID subunit 5-like n=1 Tax=Rhizophora mucronata TaxID=61149 RepID=A0A2P2MAL2_RHIMU
MAPRVKPELPLPVMYFLGCPVLLPALEILHLSQSLWLPQEI